MEQSQNPNAINFKIYCVCIPKLRCNLYLPILSFINSGVEGVGGV